MNLRIDADKERKDVYTLLVEEQPWAQFHKRIFGSSPKFKAKNIEELCEEFVEKEWDLCRNFAIKCLRKKQYQTRELKKLLEESLVNEVIIDEVIDECRNLGYLNDTIVCLWPRKILWKIRRKE